MRNPLARLNAMLEPLDAPRYCRTCGRALAVDMAVVYDAATGQPKRERWAVACPEIGMLFTGRQHWSGNGHADTHTHSMASSRPPRWLDPVIAIEVRAQADDTGYLGPSHTPEGWERRLIERRIGANA